MSREIEKHHLRSNGYFSLIEGPFDRKQHPNQQCGLDVYVRVVNHATGEVCCKKLYENTKGLHFKHGDTHYLSEFVKDVLYIPFQIVGDKD